MNKLDWPLSLSLALAVSAVSVLLSSLVYRDIPIGSIVAAALIILTTRYIRVKQKSFWQSTLVIIIWGLITYRAATPTAVGDLILIGDKLTYWYIGITGIAALMSLVLPTRSLAAESHDEASFPN
ncbi:MAG: hypothetical protein FJW76_00335 [Actinobacteria bacterium]|nr:hypothetical protein [Actinomycetota bacterium]